MANNEITSGADTPARLQGPFQVTRDGQIQLFSAAQLSDALLQQQAAQAALFNQTFTQSPAFLDAVEAVFGQNKPSDLLAKHEAVTFQLSLFPYQVDLLLLSIQDVSADQQQLARVEELTAAAAAKERFLSTMSHEIRTPLNGVIGMTSLLADTELSDEQNDYLKILQESASSLLTLVNDVLELARLEAGVLELEDQPFRLPELVDSIMGSFAVTAAEKGISLSAKVPSKVPLLVQGDRWRLRQVLVNLIGNAIKFTKEGEVTVELAMVPGGIHFSVRDTGAGIPEERLATVFERFTQADRSTYRRFGGSGLGLSIASRIVQCMGGEIQVESVVGEGSCFGFTIDLPVSDLEHVWGMANLPKPEVVPKPYRVLLADDNRTNRLIARRVLEKAGHTVVEAENGAEALDALAQGAVDLVLMDVSMPVLDGVEATKLIRSGAAGSTRAQVPIAAVTGHVLPEDRARFQRAGMNECINKPFQVQELLALVQRLGVLFDKQPV